MIGEKYNRSFVKSITFRAVVIISDFIVIMLITHRYDLAIGLIIATNAASATLYYIHERAWNRIKWGRG